MVFIPGAEVGCPYAIDTRQMYVPDILPPGLSTGCLGSKLVFHFHIFVQEPYSVLGIVESVFLLV